MSKSIRLHTVGVARHHYSLIKGKSRERCFAAFLHNNWFGAAVFAGVVGDYLVR